MRRSAVPWFVYTLAARSFSLPKYIFFRLGMLLANALGEASYRQNPLTDESFSSGAGGSSRGPAKTPASFKTNQSPSLLLAFLAHPAS